MDRDLEGARRLASKRAEEIKSFLAGHGQPATCRGPGCSGCCRGEIAIVPEEMAAIVEAMDGPAWDRVHRLAPSIRSSPKTTVCPLLDPETRLCSVYDDRPITCRLWMAVTPPECCDPDLGEADVAVPSSIGPAVVEAYRRLGLDGEPSTLGEELVREAESRV